jgi:hypothetical protein
MLHEASSLPLRQVSSLHIFILSPLANLLYEVSWLRMAILSPPAIISSKNRNQYAYVHPS